MVGRIPHFWLIVMGDSALYSRDVVEIILIVTLATLATARLNRLITTDRITNRLRTWATRPRDPQDPSQGARHPMLGYLVTCTWCVGIWTAAATTAYAFALTGWPWPWYPLVLLAAAYASALLATHAEG